MVGGTEEQKQKWLGEIAKGNALVAYAVTEPDAGSNVVAIKTKADPVTNEAGEITGYKINGSKQFISTGLYADFITVLANTPEGATFFIMEKGTEDSDLKCECRKLPGYLKTCGQDYLYRIFVNAGIG